jgi:hypothetical protein
MSREQTDLFSPWSKMLERLRKPIQFQYINSRHYGAELFLKMGLPKNGNIWITLQSPYKTPVSNGNRLI